MSAKGFFVIVILVFGGLGAYLYVSGSSGSNAEKIKTTQLVTRFAQSIEEHPELLLGAHKSIHDDEENRAQSSPSYHTISEPPENFERDPATGLLVSIDLRSVSGESSPYAKPDPDAFEADQDGKLISHSMVETQNQVFAAYATVEASSPTHESRLPASELEIAADQPSGYQQIAEPVASPNDTSGAN